MSSDSIYKAVLMDYYRYPRNYKDVSKFSIVKRGKNHRCGDELKIGVDFDNEILTKVAFQGRGCSVCIASASMMTEVVTGLTRKAALQLYEETKSWFDEKDGFVPTPPEPLSSLEAIRQYSARRSCVLLAWEALEYAIKMQ
jgi:nitrogen fixation NifU-like protein